MFMKWTLSKQTAFIISILFLYGCFPGNKKIARDKNPHTIFVFGGDIHKVFVRYVAELTDKPSPKICYVPTASADNEDNIAYWNSICRSLSLESHVLKVWVNSEFDTIPFEETLLNMDAIVVGGGNTLNMLGIWNAQGIDEVMRKALDKGIILAGGSAGSICWFDQGVSDSRPGKLSIVEGLGFLPYSNCPHYSSKNKQELYHDLMVKGEIGAGYASDDFSGILFRDGEFVEAVSKNEFNDSYYVYAEKGEIHSEKLNTRYLVSKDALGEEDYRTVMVNKSLSEYLESGESNFVMKEFENHIKKYYAAPDEFDQVQIEKVFIYKDTLIGVVNKIKKYDFHIVSLFYRADVDSDWVSIGDDLGDTVVEAEISFREKADIYIAAKRNRPL